MSAAPSSFDARIAALRRAQAVRSVVLQIILVLLVVTAGLLAGLATANIVAGDVVEALARDPAWLGPLDRVQHRSISAVRAFYLDGPAAFHAAILAFLASIVLVAVLRVRRHLLPDGVPRSRLALGLGAVAAVSVLAVVLAEPFAEMGMRAAAHRDLLLPESRVWGEAIEFSYLFFGAFSTAALAAGFASVSPVRAASIALGAVAATGVLVVGMTAASFGPFAAPDPPPPGFLDVPGREVRLLIVGGQAVQVRAVLPDVGQPSGRPAVGAAAEEAAARAAAAFGVADLRGAVARAAFAVAPLARLDRIEFARRVSELHAATRSPRTLAWLRDLLRGPFPGGRGGAEAEPSGFAARFRGGPGGGEAPGAEQPPGAIDAALAVLADTEQIYLGSAAVDVCRAETARGRLEAAARIKDVARTDGAGEDALAACVVAPPGPPGSISGGVVVDGRPAAGIVVALAHESVVAALGETRGAGPVELAALAGSPSVRTGEDGAFRFDGVPPGRYRPIVLLADPALSPDSSSGSGEGWIYVPPAGGEVAAGTVMLTARFR